MRADDIHGLSHFGRILLIAPDGPVNRLLFVSALLVAGSSHPPGRALNMEPADTQIAMLTELVRNCRPDEDGCIYLNRDVLVESLERIRDEHRRERETLPAIAGRLVGVLGE